jgi:N-acetylgalactosamine-6-sulfatase
LGIADETLVIFSSDNGPARAAGPTELGLQYDTATGAGWGIAAAKGTTGGRRGYKASLFEGGIGVPFIARWPGKIAAGKVDQVSLISAVDLLPTFCELAGVELPAGYRPDGVSQVETLAGREVPSREKPLFWKASSPWPAPKNRPEHWVSFAMVQQHWKLVANKDRSHLELFDLGVDPYEKSDLSAEHPKVVTEMRRDLEAWIAGLPAQPNPKLFSELRAAGAAE